MNYKEKYSALFGRGIIEHAIRLCERVRAYIISTLVKVTREADPTSTPPHNGNNFGNIVSKGLFCVLVEYIYD